MKALRTNHRCLFGIAFAIVLALSATLAPADPAGRLTNVTYDDGSSIDYTYDNAGNMTKIAQKGPSAGVLGLPDINAADGGTDISVLLYDQPSGSSQVYARDGTTDSLISSTNFGTDPSIAMIQLPDISGNGIVERKHRSRTSAR